LKKMKINNIFKKWSTLIGGILIHVSLGFIILKIFKIKF
jgi:hypothetical protein